MMNIKNKKSNTPIKPRWHKWKTIAIALYITFIILSTMAFTADRTIETKMQDSYTHHLRYPRDGRQSHYYVERVNTSKIGKIDLTYTTKTNSLDVDVYNIKVLNIFCRSLYEDECKDVYGIDPFDNTNYYKWYFVEKNHFHVVIDSDSEIEELSFVDTPLAYEVFVNGFKWNQGTDYFYKDDGGTALSHVPEGHTVVDLYFKPSKGMPPTAILTASKIVVPVDYSITFDASQSYDLDGEITEYIFDFGDGTFLGGTTNTYSYSKPGIYGVILTVRDDDYLMDRAYVNITVAESSILPEIQGIIPDQEKPEDSPPWALNLSMYEPIVLSENVEFYWYLTGENTSLYKISGENGTDDRLVFTPVPDAFGSNLVTIWLQSTKNITSSQSLWINITPVNDPPTISNLPDLIVHYDDPYTFDYETYVHDKETLPHALTLEIFDGYENKYASVFGLNVTYNYPQSLVGEIIYATIMVSDGEEFAQDLIGIQVSSDHVPKVIKNLPDIWMYEGTTKYNVFDLDDYFIDPDEDSIYFTYGTTHLQIIINENHTVDISASVEWSGSELVTFRARDPIGALAEDSIIVTVIPVNDRPTISGVPNFYVHYDRDYRFDLTPYVHDNDNSTDELTIIPSELEHIKIDEQNNMVIIINYPKTYMDMSVPVRLTVSDGLDYSFQDIIVTIIEDYPPELLDPLPDVVFLEDVPFINAFDLDNHFLDIDGDVLYYITGNKYINITINTNHTVDFSAPQDWHGSELTYFRATDPTGALQQDLVMVTVLPVNDPPTIFEIPEQHGNESERWVLDLEPYIFDVDNNISELEITIDTEYIVVSGHTLVFLGSPDLPKQVEVLVSDGQFTSSQMIDIHLKYSKPPQSVTLWDLFINILPLLIIIILTLIIIGGMIYRKKNRFTAEEVFLIHKGGTLITHLTRHKQANVDDIIFSGMFTAVQEFIKDTFSQDGSPGAADNENSLDELKVGDNNILIERSKNTYLAVIFSGEGSKRLRRIVIRLLDKIETKYEKILPTWDGNIRELAGTNEILSVLIKLIEEPEVSQEVQKPKEQSEQPTLVPLAQNQIIKPPASGIQTITMPIKKPIIISPHQKIKKKELLKCVKEQTGAKQPGLIAWKLDKNKGKVKITSMPSLGLRFRGSGIEKLPIALNIGPSTQRQKTVAIKIIQSRSIAKEQLPIKPPSGLDASNLSKPIKINFPTNEKGNQKEFKIDPGKSLLQQLAEMDEIE